jgi:hypothetical protein
MNNSIYEVVVGSIGTVYYGKSCRRASIAFIEYAKASEGDIVVCVKFCESDQGAGRIIFYSGSYSDDGNWNWPRRPSKVADSCRA